MPLCLSEGATVHHPTMYQQSSPSQSTRSPRLEYTTRRTQAEALESHTAKRIEELLEGSPNPRRKEKTSSDESPSVRSPHGSGLSRASHGSPILDAARQAHMEAMEIRTKKRVEEVRQTDPVNRTPPSYGEAVRLTNAPSASRVMLTDGSSALVAKRFKQQKLFQNFYQTNQSTQKLVTQLKNSHARLRHTCITEQTRH